MIGFGFSAGDIAIAVKFLWKVGEALNDTGKASGEYQQTIQSLQSLLLTLQHLESVNLVTTDASIISALRALPATVEKPILVLINDIKKFEGSLGREDTNNPLAAGFRRVQWATRNGKKVEKLGAMIAAQMQSIHLLLGTTILQTQMHSNAAGAGMRALLLSTATEHRFHADALSQSLISGQDDIRSELSSIGSSQATNSHLLLTAVEQRKMLVNQLLDQISIVAKHVKDLKASQLENTANLIATLKQPQASSGLENSTSFAQHHQNEVVGMALKIRDMDPSLVQCLYMIGLALRGLIRSLLCLAPSIWLALRVLPNYVPRSVSLLLDDAIHFEDVFGMNRKLHYAWFQHYEVFEAFLRADFRGKPGEHRVRTKMYLITSPNKKYINGEQSVTGQESWTETIRPGTKIQMSLAILGSHVNSQTVFSRRRDVHIKSWPDCQVGRISYRIVSGSYERDQSGRTIIRQDFRDELLTPEEAQAVSESREAFSEIDHFKRLYTSHEAETCYLCWQSNNGLSTGLEKLYRGKWAGDRMPHDQGVHKVLYYRAHSP